MTSAPRPQSFDDYIGQPRVIECLRASVTAARRAGRALDHFLFAGGPGLGKTSIATVVAAELGVAIRVTSGPAIEHKGALAALLTSLGDRDVLFIDEIHAIAPAILETLYTAMEDGVLDLAVGKRAIRVPLRPFTLLAATTTPGALPRPLLDRFGHVFQLEAYDEPKLATIVRRAAIAAGEMQLGADAAAEIARRSRGTPRVALRLLRRVLELAPAIAPTAPMATSMGTLPIDAGMAAAALDRLGVDSLGLDELDRRYLALLVGGPAGIEAICARLGRDRATIEALEPTLLALGLVARGPRGRTATAAGLQHLGITRLRAA